MRVLSSVLVLLAACCLLLTRSVGAYCCWDETAMYYCASEDVCGPKNCYELVSSNVVLMLKICRWEGSP